MASHRQLYYHIVFGTKFRKPTIPDIHCQLLYKYIWGIIENKKCKLYRINGSKDHIHLLVDIHPTIAVSTFVKDMKVSTSIWLKQQAEFQDFEGWSEGFAIFTISHSDKVSLIAYIKNQKEHHQKRTFADEYKTLMEAYGIDFDEKELD
ncbi:MAG: IS200/IS605 family transposase [Paludibacter sp.]|nr:IS200/IS605 family transposase [Paludibacter sp.]